MALVGGYLLGSISFARIVGRLVAPEADVTRVEMTFDDGGGYESRAASASAVRANVGTRWGLLTGLLDALKVALPILVVRMLGYPVEVQVAIAAGGLVGHVYPLYHRFRGGLGESPTYGALLFFDPLGVLVSTLFSIVAGFVVGKVVVLRESGIPIFALWAWFVLDEPWVAAFAVLATTIYHLAAVPEARRYRKAVAGREPPSNEEVSREFGMGSGLGQAIDRYGLPGLARRLVRS